MILLENAGADCFFNASLQFLIFFLKDVFLTTFSEDDVMNDSVLSWFRTLSGCMDTQTHHVLQSKFLKANLSKHNTFFNTKDQEDAIEAIDAILDILHKKLTCPTFKSNDAPLHIGPTTSKFNQKEWDEHFYGHSVITQRFTLQLKHSYTCKVCSHHSTSTEHNDKLFVPISEKHTDVHDCVAGLVQKVILTKQCDICKQDTEHIQNSYIARFPQCLIVALKRFNNDMRRVNHSIYVNNVLDFTTENITYTYELSAVIHHAGSVWGGHYWATLMSYGTFDDAKFSNEVRCVSQKTPYIIGYNLVKTEIKQ